MSRINKHPFILSSKKTIKSQQQMDILFKWLPFIVAVFTGTVALIQIRINNITNARLRWLETLKSHISDFFSEATILAIKKGVQKHIDQFGKENIHSDLASKFINEIHDDTLGHLRHIQAKYDLIKLNLNPLDKLHKVFEELLDKFMTGINQIPEKQNSEYSRLMETQTKTYQELLLVARYIITIEWEKAKRIPISFWFFLNLGKGKNLKKEILT